MGSCAGFTPSTLTSGACDGRMLETQAGGTEEAWSRGHYAIQDAFLREVLSCSSKNRGGCGVPVRRHPPPPVLHEPT